MPACAFRMLTLQFPVYALALFVPHTPVACNIKLTTTRQSGHVCMSADDGPVSDADLALLNSRIIQLQAGEARCRVIILRETLVPGQRLAMTAPPEMVELFSHRDSLPIVMLGQHRGGGRPETDYGVEVTIEGGINYRPVVPGIHPEGTADIVCAAGRLCKVVEMEAGAVGVQRSALVRWTELDRDSEAGRDGKAGEVGGISLPILEKSRALESTVDEWLRLVRDAGRERFPTHIEDVLTQLGPMPEAERPNARALWVAGLINPSPSLGPSSMDKPAAMGETVAPEIRGEAMSAASVEARLGAVSTALSESVRRLRKMVGEP